METKQLQYILEQHKLWLFDDEGKCADLRNADLRDVYLSEAVLSEADLSEAVLSGADLRNADLSGAVLRNAVLRNADLRNADLIGADLRNADLSGADLRDAVLSRAVMRNADLSGAKLPHFKIMPDEGSFVAWKKTSTGVIKIRIPAEAKRASSLVGRKCRAEFVKVLSGPGCGGSSPTYVYNKKLVYNKGDIVYADSFDPDIRLECTHGIHFYMTREEAEKH
jgi:hypothetical protein